MKTTAFSQAGALLIGSAVVLLIGALVKFVPPNPSAKPAPAGTPAASDPSSADAAATSQLEDDLPLPPNFPTALAQIIKLTRAGVGENVVLAYVQNSNVHYVPTADEMIYLHRCGVPQSVLAAIVNHQTKSNLPILSDPATPLSPAVPDAPESGPSLSENPTKSTLIAPETPSTHDDRPPAAPNRIAQVASPAPPLPSLPEPPAHPPADSDAAYFFDDLAPYGNWTDTAENGWVWQPTVEQAVPDWRPYCDDGQWTFTEAGWAWNSTYPWGWAPFHYGWWANDATLGWVWKPGHRWGPAWVTWRKTQNYYAWAPIPPGVSLNMVNFLNDPTHLGANLTAASYTFVPASRFLSRNLSRHAVSGSLAASLFAASVYVAPSLHPGIPVEEVSYAVRRPITPISLQNMPFRQLRASGPASSDLAATRPGRESGSKSNK